MSGKKQYFFLLTCVTAENQQVFPTFFSPTGQSPSLFLSCGFWGSTNQISPLFRFVPTLLSCKLCSSTLQVIVTYNFGISTLQCLFFYQPIQSYKQMLHSIIMASIIHNMQLCYTGQSCYFRQTFESMRNYQQNLHIYTSTFCK